MIGTARRERQRALQWKMLDRQRLPFVKAGQRAIGIQFARERRAYLKALNAAESPQQGLAKVLATVRDQEDPWRKVLGRLYRGVAAHFGPLALKDLEQKALPRSILDWIRAEAAAKVTDITTSTRSLLQRILEEGVEAGDAITDLARRIEESTGFSMARALRISSTEVIASAGASQVLMVADEDPRATKQWLSSRDQAVRDAHRELDGQQVLVTEAFEIDGARLRWPADSGLGAPPELTVFCRCALTWSGGAT